MRVNGACTIYVTLCQLELLPLVSRSFKVYETQTS